MFVVIVVKNQLGDEGDIVVEGVFTDRRSALYNAKRIEYIRNVDLLEGCRDITQEEWDRYKTLFLMLPEQTFEGDVFLEQWDKALQAIGDETYYRGHVLETQTRANGPLKLKDKYQALEDKVKKGL
jgi:hypothetical protein